MKHAFSAFLAICFASAALLAGCGEDPPPQPVASFCTDGSKTCEGNYLATCVDGGKAYKLSFCGESRYCTTASGAAQCKSTACEKGALSCDGKKVVQCPADGSSSESPVKECGAGDKCLGGTCVAEKCKDGESKCGWRRTLTCNGGSWTVTKCTGKQICKGGKCVERTCVPHTAKCNSDKEAAVCTVMGDGYSPQACKAGDKCYDGVCHREVKDGSPGAVADAGSSSGGDDSGSSSGGAVDVPGFLEVGTSSDSGLEKPDTLSFIFADTPNPPSGSLPIEFSISAAQFLEINSMLQITGDEGLYKIELQVASIEEFQTGTFSAAGGEAADTKMLMNDGTTDQSQVQWKYQSTDYTIKITDFEAVDGRVKGTFSGEMGDATKKGAVKYIVDGKFDIKRSQ